MDGVSQVSTWGDDVLCADEIVDDDEVDVEVEEVF